jgi:hypothetical protein
LTFHQNAYIVFRSTHDLPAVRWPDLSKEDGVSNATTLTLTAARRVAKEQIRNFLHPLIGRLGLGSVNWVDTDPASVGTQYIVGYAIVYDEAGPDYYIRVRRFGQIVTYSIAYGDPKPMIGWTNETTFDTAAQFRTTRAAMRYQRYWETRTSGKPDRHTWGSHSLTALKTA